MAKEDFLKRQIEGIMKVYAKLLHREQKKETESELEESFSLEPEPVSLQDDLETMIEQREFGKAEDLLFEVLEEAVTQGVSRRECEELVTWFYEQLNRISDEELENGDFTREEIMEGQAQALFLCLQSVH